jgi:hypothetical protein
MLINQSSLHLLGIFKILREVTRCGAKGNTGVELGNFITPVCFYEITI